MGGDDEVYVPGSHYPKPSRSTGTDSSALFVRDTEDGGKLKSAADAFYRKGEYATAVPLDEYGFVPPQKTYVPDAKEGFDAVERRREAESERQARADHDSLSRKLNMSPRYAYAALCPYIYSYRLFHLFHLFHFYKITFLLLLLPYSTYVA